MEVGNRLTYAMPSFEINFPRNLMYLMSLLLRTIVFAIDIVIIALKLVRILQIKRVVAVVAIDLESMQSRSTQLLL